MSAIKCADLQDSAAAPLESRTDQPARPSVLPPFSGKLSVDEGLKLSNENFKQLIENSFNTNINSLSQLTATPPLLTPYLLAQFASKPNCYFFKGKVVTPLSQLTATPTFPTPHVLAQFAFKAYEDYKAGETDVQYERRLDLPDGWKLLTTASNGSINNGYFGAAFWHPEHLQVVIAHRGTDPTNLEAFSADVNDLLVNQYFSQMDSASTFASKIVDGLRKVKREHRVSFHLFFTGHSLGGWLAQVTTFTTEYLKIESTLFLKSDNDQDCFHPHTVVFDSPGCKEMLLQMRDKLDVRLDGRLIDIEHLDVTSYLSAPNRINTCHKHLGTVYRIFIDLSDMGWRGKCTVLYNIETHSMKKIVQAFDPETGQVYRDEQGQLKLQVVVHWPISADLMGEEYKRFFEWAKHLNNYHPDPKDISFQHMHYYPIRYQTKRYDDRVNSFSTFSEEEQTFLQCYHWLRQWPEFCKPKELFSVMEDSQAQDEAEKILQNFEIVNDKIHCTDISALQALIPYVKRLLSLFPQIKENTKRVLSSGEIRNRVYQFETRRYVERISQSALDFNSDDLSVREFLESDLQQVLQLQVVDGDEWTGLIKVYQVLQKANCLMEGQYTVLNLERLLTLNKLMNFRTLMLSSKAPYLILVACETNQLLKEETKDLIRTLFETMKTKTFIKVILTTRSEDRVANFLQKLGREIFGNGFVKRDEELNWSDLISSSQEKLIERSVKFQGANISLKELVFAECPVAHFLSLGALLEEKELKIADSVPKSNGYNESYYIGRIFRHQKTIKPEIYSDNDVIEGGVFLATSEQEFKQLCQLNPNSNVHWLQKDNSGKLLWQQSQGTLETLRRYIDIESSHTYTADDLDKLLEQVEHQRVMLISDTAGMGKSTVLTHLSKQTKQKFPAKWVVTIDLNDHTDALKELEQEQIDKENVVEFVSEKLLKLEPGLEKELFKQCCEQKHKLKVILMLDGFDEVSPFYKDTVIDLLQALRQTAVEQLWVTTRPHVREELEDKLQQLSYTLEPFSEEDQVEFLTKFWSLQDWFTETEDKRKERENNKLAVYAEHLIKKLGNSVSDKDRQFIGIPLQCRMLAEAFDEDVKIFCESTESTPELPFKLDLIELYRLFIERKYDIYQEEKLQVPVNSAFAIDQRKREIRQMSKEYQLLALKVLFTEEQIALFQNNTEISFSTEQLTRTGIVQVSHGGKLHFIRRIFAEYYVADYLVNCFTEGNNTSEQVLTFVLKDIFQKEQHQVIRAFIDGLLSRYKISKVVLKQYGNRIHDLRKNGDKILHRAAYEGNSNIIEFLLDSVQAGDHTGVVKKLLLEKDEEGLTAWTIAVLSNNIQVLEKVWECAERKLTTEEIQNKLLLAGVTVKIKSSAREAWWGRQKTLWSWRQEILFLQFDMQYEDWSYEAETVWKVAALLGNLEVLQKLWEWAEKKLTREVISNKLLLGTDNEGRTVWHVAAEQSNLEMLQKVWEWAKEKLTTEEINNKLLLSTENGGKTVWHVAAHRGNLEMLKKIWQLAKEKQTTEEIYNKVLLVTDYEGKTAWHLSAKWGNLEILQKLWDWAKEKLTTQEINNEFLLGTDNEGKTAWRLAAECNKLETLQKVWELAKEKLTTEEINNKLLLGTDNEGRTVWHVAAQQSNLETLQNLWEWAKEKLTTEEINNKLLLGRDNEGKTAWHLAAECGNLEILQKLWEWAKMKLTTEEINNKLLLGTDNKGRTAWQLATLWGKLESLQKVWEWAKENLTTEEINNKLLLGTDNEGNTAWHLAALCGNLEALQKVWDLAKEKLTKEEIYNKLLLGTDNEGRTAWHLAAKRGTLNTLINIWEWAKEKLTTEEINKLILCTDNEGKTAFHWTAGIWNLDVLLKVWDSAEEKLTTQEKSKWLLGTDSQGMTACHWAVVIGNLDLLLEVREWAEKKLTTEEIKNNFLLATDNERRTVFHLAVKRGELEMSQKVWEWANEKLTTKEINNNLLLATDDKGRTIFHMAAEWGKLKLLQKVWEWVNQKLTSDEIKNELLLGTDNEGRTAWHLAAVWGNLEVLENVLEWAKEKLTTEEINNKLLLGTDNKGKTAWHLAEMCGHLEILQKVWECAKRELTTEEIKNRLLLGRDNEGKTVWHSAAEWGNLEILQIVWDWAKKKLTTEEINNKLLLGTDTEGNTAWHLAAKRGNLESLQKVWDWAKKKLTTQEVNNKLLLGTDNEGRTAWHLATMQGKLESLQKVWEWAKEKLTTEEINNKLLLGTDTEGNTAWHLAAKWGNLEILQKVWEWAKEKLTTEEINNKLLLGTDTEGNTAWHMAAKWGNLEILQKLWDWSKEKLTTEEINNKLLLGTDNEGRTAWHMAAKWGNLKTLKNVWEWVRKELTTEEIHKMLLDSINTGMAAFHEAVYEGKLDVLLQVWEWDGEKLTTEEISDKLSLTTGILGATAWNWAACHRKFDYLMKVWEWAEEKLTTEEINKLLLGPDNEGITAYHWAAWIGNLDVLLKVWEWAEKKLTKEEMKNNFLLATDDDGRTVFHMAVKCGELELLQKIWKWANEKLTTHEIKSKLLLARDYEGRNIFQVATEQGRQQILEQLWEWAVEKLTTEEINNNLLISTDD